MARNGLKNVMRLVDEMVQEVPVQDSFLHDLQRSIEMTDKANARKPSQTFKPSGMNCIRQSYYEITAADRDDDENGNCIIGICESGTDRHERLQKAVASMKDMGIDCEYVDVAQFVKDRNLTDLDIVSQQGMETKLYNQKYNISFLCDGIIFYKGQYYILVIKTESSYKWMARNSVDPAHYNQATAYSLSFGINQVIFLYENRDNCTKKTYLFEVTGDMKQALIGYMENCNEYIKQHKAPPKPADVSRKTCDYCKYKGQCRKDA